MTRGTVFGTSRMSTGCCSRERNVSLEAGLAMDVWLEWFHSISIAMLFGPVLTLMIGRGAGNPPNRARMCLRFPRPPLPAPLPQQHHRLASATLGYRRDNDRLRRFRLLQRPGYLRCDAYRARAITALVDCTNSVADRFGLVPAARLCRIDHCQYGRFWPPFQNIAPA